MIQRRPHVQPSHRLLLAGLLAAGLAACSPAPTPAPPSNAPYVTSVSVSDGITSTKISNGQTNVADGTDIKAITAEVQLLSAQSGNGIDSRTVTAGVKLVEAATNTAVPIQPNTTGGGDAIIVNPVTSLKSNTKYIFEVTSALTDVNGVNFQPFNLQFTTGALKVQAPSSSSQFVQVPLNNVPDDYYTAVEMGPDNKLYASTLTGKILRFAVNGDGTLGTPQIITSLQRAEGGPRTIIGLKFDPASTASNLILWISNNYFYDFTKNAPDWSGKITRLSGPDLETVQDVVVGLPRSVKDHMTNNVSFNPKEPGVLYLLQGASNSYGAPDSTWGNRPEYLLTAALLRLDLNKLSPAAWPLNVQTEASPDGSNALPSYYNPYAGGAPLTLYATGIRNGYSMVWHSNGQLYVPTNGSATGGNAPAKPNTLPAVCANRSDYGPNFTLPDTPALNNIGWVEPDFLFRVDKGGYYGHPNPSRCEYTLDGGNVASSPANLRVPDYPVGVQPDPNYRGAAYVFPEHASADGAVEYTRPGSALDHRLLVIRFSVGKDIVALDPSGAGGSIVGSLQQNIQGFDGFNPAPLNLTEDRSNGNGNLYVTQLRDVKYNNDVQGDSKIVKGTITLVKPNQ